MLFKYTSKLTPSIMGGSVIGSAKYLAHMSSTDVRDNISCCTVKAK